jgi:hypothetical protein
MQPCEFFINILTYGGADMANPKTKLSEPQKVQSIIQNLTVHTDGKNSYVEIPSENHRKKLAMVSSVDFKDW